jgi:hypothetical protein
VSAIPKVRLEAKRLFLMAENYKKHEASGAMLTPQRED